MQIVLRDDFASLEGKVSIGASDSAFVIAIPEVASQKAQHMLITTDDARAIANVALNPQGVVTFHQLAPGSYKVLAVDRLDGFEYANPEVLQKYSSKIRDITLAPNQKGSVDLALMRFGD